MEKVSCLMPTFNRFPNYGNLINESLESFLRQDYPNKELIICNDTPNQELVFDHPQVKVFNVPERFPTLSDKLIWMMERAEGDVLCRWDDDDISLAWRLSYSMNMMGDKIEWRPENHWYCPNVTTQTVQKGSIHLTEHPGNTHAMGIWRREVLGKIGGYPPKACGWEDQAFNQAMFHMKVAPWMGDLIPLEHIFYLYRWGVSPNHLSGVGGGNEGLALHYERIGSKEVIQDKFHLFPNWVMDYQQFAAKGDILQKRKIKLSEMEGSRQ